MAKKGARNRLTKMIFNRVVKVLILTNNTIESKKVRHIVAHYCATYGVKVGNKHYVKILQKEFDNPNSPIFRNLILPGLPEIRKKSTKGKGKSGQQKRRAEYNAYLKSDVWISFKNKIKADRGNKCEKCGYNGKGLHGHHLTYERFKNELPEDIQILCKGCHEEVHRLEKEKNDRKRKIL